LPLLPGEDGQPHGWPGRSDSVGERLPITSEIAGAGSSDVLGTYSDLERRHLAGVLEIEPEQQVPAVAVLGLPLCLEEW
jgi:hypothetical protein